MRKIISTLLISASMFSFAHVSASNCCGWGTASDLSVCPMGTPTAIDGDASDWGSTWLQMTQSPTSNTTSGMTAKFQMEYDNSNLYIIAVINDSTPGDTSYGIASYARDCFEIMMSLDTLSSGGITGMFQFRRVYGWDGALGHTGGTTGITDGALFGNGPAIPASWNNNPNFKVKEVIDGNTYTQEWQLPWDSLSVRMDTVGGKNPGGPGAWDKKQFKLEVQASDNTGTGRTQQEFWYGNSDKAWNNSAYQQVVKLQGLCSNPGINTIVITNDINMSATDDHLILSRYVSELSIYNAIGQLVLRANNTSNVNIGTLRKGLYVAIADGKSCKFLR
jgi:Carbohydrate family 9 binding domain-like